MAWLLAILEVLLRVLLPWVVNQSRPTAEDADGDGELRARLEAQVRKHWSAP